MTIRLRQIWKDLEVVIVHDYLNIPRIEFPFNFFVDGINKRTVRGIILNLGEKIIWIYPYAPRTPPDPHGSMIGDEIGRPGQKIEVQLVLIPKPGIFDYSNPIVYEKSVVPTEVIGAGIGITQIITGMVVIKFIK